MNGKPPGKLKILQLNRRVFMIARAEIILEDADSGEIGVLSGKTLSKGLKLKASQSGSSVFAVMEIPMPVPQIKIPLSHSPD